MTQEADRVQPTRVDFVDTSNSVTAQPPILNLLHIPKTGGSSVWQCLVEEARAADAVTTRPIWGHDYYFEALKDEMPLCPSAAAMNFFYESGLLSAYCSEIYERHASQYVLFKELLAQRDRDYRVLAHVHFHAPFSVDSAGARRNIGTAETADGDTTTENASILTTIRDSDSRFLSHAAHLLKVLRQYQYAIDEGRCLPEWLLAEFDDFPRNKSVRDFCSYLARTRPGIATFQLRYLLASLCSGSSAESFEIMSKWTNRDVIREFTDSLDRIRQKTMTIRLEEDGHFSVPDVAQTAMSAFGISDFQVDRCVLETVSTPGELKGKANCLRKLFRADRSFFKDLAGENALLRQLHDAREEKVILLRFRRGEGRGFRLWR